MSAGDAEALDAVGVESEINNLQPSTPRGRRTREKLLAAAAIVFQRDGYIDAKITDITQTAGVANGTFYTYFRSKTEILSALVDRINEEMFAATSVPRRHDQTAVERIEQVTRAYYRAYREHAGLLGILEQVATFNPQFREMRRETREIFRSRTEAWIRRLIERGVVDESLSPRCTAEALTSMVSNFCYVSMVLGESYEEDEAITTLTNLWVRGVGLDPSAP